MAINSSLTSPLPKFPSFHQINKSYKSSLPVANLHFHDFAAVSRQSSKLSGLKSNGFLLCSLSNDSSLISKQIEVNDTIPNDPQVQSSLWNWKGYSIRYQHGGNSGPALVLIHGFGANSDHWRKNIPALAKSHRVYAIDLIGYGYSDKPNPRDFGDDSFYTFETWATQLNDFCVDVVKDKAFFICNSIGGVVGLQAAVMEPQICKGIFLLNISLRMLHVKKQPWFAKPFISSFQSLLRNTDLGTFFFKAVATSESVKNILCQCYHDTSQVTDELVQKILLPGLEPGAVDVFLTFICYSGGPLPEELLPQVKCPVLIGWGEQDPWEPIELGRAYGNFDTVEDFIVLPNVGHCPQVHLSLARARAHSCVPALNKSLHAYETFKYKHALPAQNRTDVLPDEAPHLVNPLVESFVARHAKSEASISTVI